MKDYYGKRAREYEEIYFRDDPVRQSEINLIKIELSSWFAGKSVLEVACGTGYWTEVISKTARTVTAFDFSPEVIEIAKSKNLQADFFVDDAYGMNDIKGSFDAGCANFWFSHIPKNKLTPFLNRFHQKLLPGSRVLIADNVFVDGIGGELVTRIGDVNTYKRRVLKDGSMYEILKNYYTENQLRKIFNGFTRDAEMWFGECFWYVKYQL